MDNKSIEEYLRQLEIRIRAVRRSTRILGTVLFLSLTAFFIIGLIRPISQREAVLITVLIASFSLGLVVSLARSEALQAGRDLAKAILANDQDP